MTRVDLREVVSNLGQERHYNDRLQRQARSEGEQWVMWEGRHPVGGVFLWMSHLEEEAIRSHLPGVPLINNLIVVPAQRNRGLGTALLRHAEARAADLGFQRTALGVEVGNADARRLYEREGYVEWSRGIITSTWTETDEFGRKSVISEETAVLVKDLTVHL